jgi:hypothetical protein
VKRKRSDSKRRRDSRSCDVVGDVPSCGAEPRTFGGDLSPLKEQKWARGGASRTFASVLVPPTEQYWGREVAPRTFASDLGQPNDPDYSLRGVTTGLVFKRLVLVTDH